MCIYIRYSMSIIGKVFHYEENEISVIKCRDDMWFRGKDIAKALGYSIPCKAIHEHVDPEDRSSLEHLSKGGLKRTPLKNEQKSATFINESGLYSLMLQSKLESAKALKRWVTKDVSPFIRKTDLIINNLHKRYSGFAIEMKSPKGNGVLSPDQSMMLRQYQNNCFKTLVSNDYDQIIEQIIEHLRDVRMLCLYCPRRFISSQSLENHIKFVHKM